MHVWEYNQLHTKQKSSWKTTNVHQQLEAANEGFVDNKHNPRVLNRLWGKPIPIDKTTPIKIQSESTEFGSNRDIRTTPERSNLNRGGSSGRFPLDNILSTKEGWSETCDQPEELEQVRETRIFQDGRHSHCEGPSQARRLANKGGYEGRIFHHTNPLHTQKIPAFCGRRTGLRVKLPAVRPLISSMGLYQDPKAVDCSLTRVWSEASDLHRRHSSHGRIQSNGRTTHKCPGILAGMPRLCYKPEKICVSTPTIPRVFGICYKYHRHGDVITSGKTKRYPCGGKETSKGKHNLSKVP